MTRTRAATTQTKSGEEPSPTKKRRVEGEEPHKKRRRGKRSELCQLNLDVLFLLAAYIQPLDLLNLARTCKSLRELLTDKSSEFVWKTARRQVEGFPDCPADLTELEYAHLAFYPRCHGCGKVAKKILWEIRRRYCAECKPKRLCRLNSHVFLPHALRSNYVFPSEYLNINGQKGYWVDIEQKDALCHAFNNASDRDTFLKERRNQLVLLGQHVYDCQCWERKIATDRRSDLHIRRSAREESIFERIKQQGYGQEVGFFGRDAIQRSHKAFFRTSKPLTDEEWDLMLPEWVVTMNEFRSRRLEAVVCKPRRVMLNRAYDHYVKFPSSSNEPVVELFPDYASLLFFQDFRDIITAPEGTQIGENPFGSAFARLPALTEEWEKQVAEEFAKLIVIPSQLTAKDISSPRSGTAEVPPTPKEKLRLACALFCKDQCVAPYPEILFVSRSSISFAADGEPVENVSIQTRLRIEYLEDVPYIIQACGLDPSVATAEDMDRRNARLICRTCDSTWVMDWRNAVQHAFSECQRNDTRSVPEVPQYQLVGDEHIDAIQAAEIAFNPWQPFKRCLLCRPRVGNVMEEYLVVDHLIHGHALKEQDIRPDVQCTTVSSYCMGARVSNRVKMEVGEDGQVKFNSGSTTV